MPFRDDILETFPNAIRELNRRGVDIGYLLKDNKYLLTNKQGIRKFITEEELASLEADLSPSGSLEKVQIELTDYLL